MKDWNITQLNFSNEEYKKLCSAYGKIFIIIAQIDGDTSEKEIDNIVSLIVRTNLKTNDFQFFKKLNHIDIETENKINGYTIKNNYLQVFELENLIFFEIERNIVNFIKAITDKELINRIFEEKIEDFNQQLNIIKTIIESKKDIIGEQYINAFYEGLYDYTEKIANIVSKGFLIRKIGKEEKQLLEIMKTELNIIGDIKDRHSVLNRHNYILFE